MDAPKSTILVSSSFSVKPFSAAVNLGTEAHTDPPNQSAGEGRRVRVGGDGERM